MPNSKGLTAHRYHWTRPLSLAFESNPKKGLKSGISRKGCGKSDRFFFVSARDGELRAA